MCEGRGVIYLRGEGSYICVRGGGYVLCMRGWGLYMCGGRGVIYVCREGDYVENLNLNYVFCHLLNSACALRQIAVISYINTSQMYFYSKKNSSI